MAPRFYSKEWVEAVKQAANSNEEYLKKTKGFTAKYLFIVTDCPDGNDVSVLWDMQEGKVAGAEYRAKPAPSDMRIGVEHWDESISLAKNQGSYDTFAKIQRKELTMLGALGAKLFKVEGDLVKGMAMMAYNVAFGDVQAALPCEY